MFWDGADRTAPISLDQGAGRCSIGRSIRSTALKTTSAQGTAPGLEYDPYSYAIQDDPFAVYQELRDRAPVYFSEARHLWVLSRFEDVRSALRDHETFSSEPGVDLEPDLHGLFGGSFLQRDEPAHGRLRSLVKPFFAPGRTAALETLIRRHTIELVDALPRRGADLYSQLALPLPVRVICTVLGVPPRDGPRLKRWTDLLELREEGDDRILAAGAKAGASLRAYFERLAARRAARPRDDLVSAITAAGPDGERLTIAEAAGMSMLLFMGGNQTTASLVTHALYHLHERPEERRRLADRPGEIPAAVEELLRYEGPIQLFVRTLTRDVVLHGQAIPRGARVGLLFGAANRDERFVADPDRLDLSRDSRGHLAFGYGIHFCVGAPLARLEARVALEEFLARVREYTVIGPVERFHTAHERRIVCLRVDLD